jgi:hypothetical protein
VTATAPAPPPLDAGLEQLLRRMRLPHMRRIAPDVLATAKAQRWDPAEVLRVLLAEEVAGRDRSALDTCRTHRSKPMDRCYVVRGQGSEDHPHDAAEAALYRLGIMAMAEARSCPTRFCSLGAHCVHGAGTAAV